VKPSEMDRTAHKFTVQVNLFLKKEEKTEENRKKTRQLRIIRGHIICFRRSMRVNGLARPADESMLALDIGTTGHGECLPLPTRRR